MMIQALKSSVRHLATATMKQTEFRMPVPWGELRGRVWGPDHGHPVLCLHGWSDNCGSFNSLIPLLPNDHKYVAVDLVGHGLSSHRPAGVFYTFPAYVADVLRLVEGLQWKRFSIIGHSMGGNIGGMFSALYPEMVEALVLLDSYGFLPTGKALTPDRDFPSQTHLQNQNDLNKIMRKGMDEMIQYEKKSDERKEKVYTYEAAKERLKAANPFLSEQSAKILLERGTQEVEGGVVFSRDFRINLTNIVRITLEQSLLLQEQIKAKVLILQANQGLTKIYPQTDEIAEHLQTGWKKTNTTFVTVEGDHHIHLNQPEVVAPIISDFLQQIQTSQQTAHPSDKEAAKL